MSTLEEPTPAAPAEEPVLPVFNNGITPQGQPPLPVITEPVPCAEVNTDYTPPTDLVYRPPVEAVAGVGGIAGVTAEQE